MSKKKMTAKGQEETPAAVDASLDQASNCSDAEAVPSVHGMNAVDEVPGGALPPPVVDHPLDILDAVEEDLQFVHYVCGKETLACGLPNQAGISRSAYRPEVTCPECLAAEPDPIEERVIKAMRLKPEWPTEPFTINWPWGDEVNPQVGDIVGWNWNEGQVAVIIKVPQYQNTEPWEVAITTQPMSDTWQRYSHVVDITAGKEIKNVLWYTKWNRAGASSDPALTFEDTLSRTGSIHASEGKDIVLFTARCLVTQMVR
jgi:hypothetical protein